jgi:hypothetical protein
VTALTLPKLVTCSYRAYRRPMGLLVRITLYPPRFVPTPDPRWSDYDRLPYLVELAPKRSYFYAEPAEFDRKYVDQLNEHADQIAAKLAALPAEAEALCLSCFEQRVASGADCHRRIFAVWARERWGVEIEEMDPAR